ncbi:MAG: hypothetical protein SOH48_09165 [Eubacteriales bacterium]|jgi:hypothetical protein
MKRAAAFLAAMSLAVLLAQPAAADTLTAGQTSSVAVGSADTSDTAQADTAQADTASGSTASDQTSAEATASSDSESSDSSSAQAQAASSDSSSAQAAAASDSTSSDSSSAQAATASTAAATMQAANATLVGAATGSEGDGVTTYDSGISAFVSNVYRMYNPNSGEHFYTEDVTERNHLVSVGWNYEGIAWVAPKTSSHPMYRVYNPNTGDHHYTSSLTERNWLVSLGWRAEGISWYVQEWSERPSSKYGFSEMHRLYNPNCTGSGAHFFTISDDEKDYLVSKGWKYEGVVGYSLSTSPAVSIYDDNADYSIEANVTLTGSLTSDGGVIAKVMMPTANGGAEAFDFVYDKGWTSNSYNTYFYVENVMSNITEAGTKGKSYAYLSTPVVQVGTPIKLRISWYKSTRQLKAYINDMLAFTTTTSNTTPTMFACEGGGKYRGDTVKAVFSDIKYIKNGKVTALTSTANCPVSGFNGYTATRTSSGFTISGTATVPAGVNWDTAISVTGSAMSAYGMITLN